MVSGHVGIQHDLRSGLAPGCDVLGVALHTLLFAWSSSDLDAAASQAPLCGASQARSHDLYLDPEGISTVGRLSSSLKALRNKFTCFCGVPRKHYAIKARKSAIPKPETCNKGCHTSHGYPGRKRAKSSKRPWQAITARIGVLIRVLLPRLSWLMCCRAPLATTFNSETFQIPSTRGYKAFHGPLDLDPIP